MDNKISKQDADNLAISIVKKHVTSTYDASAFVTDRVMFQMRNLIKVLRKNYWGIFDEPIDPTTGRKKIWVPMTEVLVETAVKSCDLDTKDINFRAKKPSAVGLTNIVRCITKDELDEMQFGELLDLSIRQLAIDGTVVWKTCKAKDKGEVKPHTRVVDLLNFYIDPLAGCIQKANIAERALMTQEEIKAMDGWENTSDIPTFIGNNPNDVDLRSTTDTKTIDVYEYWGEVPLILFTGDEKDRETMIQGQLVVCGIDHPGSERVLLMKKNNEDWKPYEEAWYTRIAGRWYGKGVCEKVMWLQMWINMIVNIRINRAQFSQLGIFKLKRGSGITQQMMSRMTANGAISVNNMDDVQQMVMQEASQSSYTDEENAFSWGQRLTSAFDSAIGEALPSTTPATNAILQNQSAQSAYVLIKEGVGMFLQRWLKRHFMPIIFSNIGKDDVIRYMADPNELRMMNEAIVNEMVVRKLRKGNMKKMMYDPVQVMDERQRALEQLARMPEERYIQLMEDINPLEYDVQVYITNEEMDKGVLVQNLLSALQLAPEYKDQIVGQVFDLMGLNYAPAPQQAPQGSPNVQMATGGTPTPSPAATEVPSQSIQSLTTNANVPV